MPELLNKSDVMRVINEENAVVLCCTLFRTADQVIVDICKKINELPVYKSDKQGRWREISAHRDDNGYILRDYECTHCLGILRDVSDTDNPELEMDRYCPMCGAYMRGDKDAGSKTD